VIAYRRFVQHRPITGPEAHRLPTRGFGVAKLRERLERLGVDPRTIGGPPAPPAPSAPDERAEHLRKLRDLRDAGILTDEEYEAKKAEVERRSS
jgi:hypothetical protein